MAAGNLVSTENKDWQRLDVWLWCARFAKARSGCVRLVEEGSVRINRQPTGKPHARLRVGDVLTLPVRGDVLVLRVLSLAARRGPAAEARGLYEVLEAPSGGLHEGENDSISPPPATRVGSPE